MKLLKLVVFLTALILAHLLAVRFYPVEMAMAKDMGFWESVQGEVRGNPGMFFLKVLFGLTLGWQTAKRL